MKNISTYSKRGYKYQPEIIETEIGDWQSRHTSPRHMSAPETQSHREMNINKIDYAPRVCQINAGEENQATIAANIALGILKKYQLGDLCAQQKHLENVCSSLEHRLQVAKSQGDNQLLNILQDEYKQLVSSPSI